MCVTGTFYEPVAVSDLVVEYYGDLTDDVIYDAVALNRYFYGTETICYTRAVPTTFVDN